MRYVLYIIRFALVASYMIFCVCGMQSLTGGTSTAENGRVTGRIADQNGYPAPQVQVRLFAAGGDPMKGGNVVPMDTTDKNGAYYFDGVAPGAYNIQSVHLVNRTRTLRFGISSAHDTITVAQDMLAAPGTLKCLYPELPSDSHFYVFIPGTSFFAPVQNGYALLDSVPAAVIPAICFGNSIDSAKNHVIDSSVTIASGETAMIRDYASWKYAKKIFLNTTSSGAGVPGNVTNFPVLVRLSSGNFVFNQTKTNGSDILFTKPDGTPLPYEIERWDAVAQKADIWVRLDTIYGNDSTHHVTMRWGNPDTAIVIKSAMVFDTSDGFIGVWHMNEDPSTGTATIKDRTAHAFNASPFGSMARANIVNGAVGNALVFDGIDDYIDAGVVPIPGKYSMGLWVRLETADQSQRFIWKDSTYTLWFDEAGGSIRMEHMSATTWWRGLLQDGGSPVPMTAGIWYYLTGTFDGTSIILYINGVEVSRSNPFAVPPVPTMNPLYFGKYRDIDYVNGIMDEIRIESAARSADWVRLCYMNQKDNDSLVVFR